MNPVVNRKSGSERVEQLEHKHYQNLGKPSFQVSLYIREAERIDYAKYAELLAKLRSLNEKKRQFGL